MSVRARQVLVLLVLAVALVARAAQPGGMLALGGALKSWPAEVMVSAPPPVNIYGDRPDLRILQLVDSMNAMWARAFAAAGDEYDPPKVDTSEGAPAQGCGSGETGWAGIYCHRGARIVVDTGDEAVRRAVLGEQGADALLGYVLAHEVGHHVQVVRDQVHAVDLTGGGDAVLRAELHAECRAGLWGRARGRPPPPQWSYAPDAAHGTVAQQRHWLERGHAAGRPADCDDVWSAAL